MAATVSYALGQGPVFSVFGGLCFDVFGAFDGGHTLAFNVAVSLTYKKFSKLSIANLAISYHMCV